jgi:hypothetical protein
MTMGWRRLLRRRPAAAAGGPPMPMVVGAPRSGTTLLRLMLDAHPQLAIPPETGFLRLAPELEGRGREAFFAAVVGFPESAPAWSEFGIPVGSFERGLAAVDPFTVAGGFRAFYRLYAARHGKPRWGDKTPQYCRHLPVIAALLPEARFVHLVRDGRDVAVSLRERWFSPGHDIEVQAAFWRDQVVAARRDGPATGRFLEVRFEDLVCEPEPVLRRICDFVELAFDPAMLSHSGRAAERLAEHGTRYRSDGTVLVSREERLRQQAHVDRPPDPAKIGVWRTGLSAEEARRFESVAGDLLAAYGYSLAGDG